VAAMRRAKTPKQQIANNGNAPLEKKKIDLFRMIQQHRYFTQIDLEQL